jgi:hypothetical protein
MLNSEESNQRSAATETDVAEQFQKLGYSVKKLDRKSSKRRRPDFLISNSSGRQMLCEVKTVDSGGYLRDKGVHVSMFDEKLSNSGVFETEIDLRKIDGGLADAVDKRKALVEDDSSYADLPLLVAFAFDFFAEYLHCYPRSFGERDERFREVSGILTIARDIERSKTFAKLSDEEQERRVKAEFEGNAEVNDHLPPRSTDFVLVRNKAAVRPVPKDFQRRCYTERYDESM